MPRNLDLTALRAFVAVADAGGVTRAAGLLNLTQSAVSMQLKRLEDSLGQGLFLRAARKLTLTAEGEQLMGFARRMLAINDEALSRLTSSTFEGEIRLGVPHDIVYPAIPGILKRLAAQYPRLRINLASSFTLLLKDAFAKGEMDVILTTEERPGTGGEELSRQDLVWIGAPEGTAWCRQPLRLGFKDTCIFRPTAQAALDAAGLPWEMAIDGESEQAVEAIVAADLAISARLRGRFPDGTAEIVERCGLPDLGGLSVCLYVAPTVKGEAAEALLSELRLAYGS
ncbi:LysR family transcriptional regulator [Gemmobacter fulvus]|uniref:LysR family transcriptional regulator n=1 Tax=Gemmobacter fulvus TaxID=2840474 RepID=A0A975P9I7_9RHOB|nr:LysR family transcriptional regulator [Gemmobacter fulvus]MBT9244399.1 LysR family transcriptional regulator [Gemmobacter fulvus]QWK91276.1 LysR family transcriptional regulator [Gemmobacter fulvus]